MAQKNAPKDGERPQYPLRMPEGMRDQLKREAEKNNRTMNAEIVARLETSLDPIGNQIEANNYAQWLHYSRLLKRMGQMGHAVVTLHTFMKQGMTVDGAMKSVIALILEEAENSIREADAATSKSILEEIKDIDARVAALKQLTNDAAGPPRPAVAPHAKRSRAKRP